MAYEEKPDGKQLFYLYDSYGYLTSIRYYSSDSSTLIGYYVTTNSQGDVVGIYNADGVLRATYEYDAWGNIIAIKNGDGDTVTSDTHIAKLNSVRYRSYCYDNETGLYYVISRYYNPQVGRFINSDAVISGIGGDILGYNVFAYCMNNPVNFVDPTGNWVQELKIAIKMIAKFIVKPLVDTAQSELAKIDGTYSRGINVSGTPGIFDFSFQVGASIDTNGDFAIQWTPGGGIATGTPGVSISAYTTITNAPSIYKLEDTGYQIGGIIAADFAAGCDINIIPDNELNTTYYGLTTIAGLGASAEIHVNWGATKTVESSRCNIFDLAEKCYIKIMEW